MAFTELELARVRKLVGPFCAERSPAHIANEYELAYRIFRHDVTIFERRPAWRGEGWMETPVAKCKFVRTANEWRLYWQRRDLKWHAYEPFPRNRSLERVLAEIGDDPYGCFFG